MQPENLTYFYTMTWLISFLGGGVIVAAINWVRIARSEKKDRKIRFLEKQVQNLYGPLYYLILQNEKLFTLNTTIDRAYNNEYVGKKLNPKKTIQDTICKDASQSIATQNKYIEILKKNNVKISKLLDQYYVLIDPNDIEITILFFEHHIRLTTEVNEKGELTTPLIIYEHMGNISFLHPKVSNRIKENFLKKRTELDKLLDNK